MSIIETITPPPIPPVPLAAKGCFCLTGCRIQIPTYVPLNIPPPPAKTAYQVKISSQIPTPIINSKTFQKNSLAVFALPIAGFIYPLLFLSTSPDGPSRILIPIMIRSIPHRYPWFQLYPNHVLVSPVINHLLCPSPSRF